MEYLHSKYAFCLDPTIKCGSYGPGHNVHFIQWRLSWEEGPGVAATVTAVDDDGTIHFADGTTQWYHLPAKLRQEIELTNGAVILTSPYVLRVARGDGAWSGFSLGDEPTPCTGVASSAAKSAGKQVVRANNG